MKKGTITFQGKRFFTLMLAVYILVAIFDTKSFQLSFNHTLSILSQIWPIFILIIVITTLVNFFLNSQQIMKHFGDKSGLKGYLYALIAGVVSHGPMFAWYGLLSELRAKGLKDELIIVFFYARAIKIPMIPFSIAIFGLSFTILISFYILLFAFLQGQFFATFQKDNT